MFSRNKKRKCEVTLACDLNDFNEDEMKKNIEYAVKDAKMVLHRTQHPTDPYLHQAIVCIICDTFVIGTESIHKLSYSQIIKHSHRLSVETYERFYHTKLKEDLKKQYRVNRDGLKDLLLSPRSRKFDDGYTACNGCSIALGSKFCTKTKPPKFAIANGFAIGSIPKSISITDKNGTRKKINIEQNNLTELMKTMLAPIRPYGYIFSYSGGSQKSIRGNYQFFEMDHDRLGAVVNQLNQAGFGEHIYVVLCGRMTLKQKNIIRTRATINTQLFIDLLTWFIDESGHQGFKNTTAPDKSPQPIFIEDSENNNNTDKSINEEIENNMECGTFHFSTAQNPSSKTSVFRTEDKFAMNLLNESMPTLLTYGGTYANSQETNIENILPCAFPFGSGGIQAIRPVKISPELVIKHYMRLSLPQFMEAPTILILNHINNRYMSYKTGVMMCRSSVDGTPLGETISTLTSTDLEQIRSNKTDCLNTNTQSFLKAISTSCRSMGNTPEAAKFNRRKMFAMLDYFGLNSLFLTTTPDDECNMRVRLYSDSGSWVSVLNFCVFFKI